MHYVELQYLTQGSPVRFDERGNEIEGFLRRLQTRDGLDNFVVRSDDRIHYSLRNSVMFLPRH